MAVSFTPAFSQIRLNGQFLSVSGDNRMALGTDAVMLVRDSGAFTSSAIVQNTGSQLYSDIIGFSGQANTNFATITNLTITGQALYNDIIGLSGVLTSQYLTTGSQISFVTGLSTGSSIVYINFLNYTFSSTPKVQVTLEMGPTNNIGYFTSISGRSTTGFFCAFSDIIAETGLSLDIFAKL